MVVVVVVYLGVTWVWEGVLETDIRECEIRAWESVREGHRRVCEKGIRE